MEIMEQEILQQIVISENERLPQEMIEELYNSIMSVESEEQQNLLFDALTKEFVKRINDELNTSIRTEDLLHKDYTKKVHLEEYGNTLNIAVYAFKIGEAEYNYSFYLNSKISKRIFSGTRGDNFILISNNDNEIISSYYNAWRKKYRPYGYTTITIDTYYKFMIEWEKGTLQQIDHITVENIRYWELYFKNVY